MIAHIEHGYSLREIATHLGCSVTTVHRRVHDRDGPPASRSALAALERRSPDPLCSRRGTLSETAI